MEKRSSVVSQNGMGANNRHLYEAEALVISVYQAWAGKDARVQRYSVGNQGSDRPSNEGEAGYVDTGIQRLSHWSDLSVRQYPTNSPYYFLLETQKQVLKQISGKGQAMI